MKRLEVIVQNEQDAIEAAKYGADQLELVCAINEGGLTPSYGTVKRVLQSVEIPTMVMVRPQSYSYHYSNSEIEAIKEDVKMIHDLGAAGIVFGCLTEDGFIDEKVLQSVIDVAGNLDITFHRAFDNIKNIEEGYRLLCNYSQHVKRVLTSGGENEVISGLMTLKRLVSLQRELDGPIIMPGGGINEANIKSIYSTLNADEYHVGSAIRMNNDYSKQVDVNAMHSMVLLIE